MTLPRILYIHFSKRNYSILDTVKTKIFNELGESEKSQTFYDINGMEYQIYSYFYIIAKISGWQTTDNCFRNALSGYTVSLRPR